MEAVAADVRHGSPAARLSAMGRRYVQFASSGPALYELMFSPRELRADDPELRAASAASLRALTGVTSAEPTGGPKDLTVVSWAFAHGVAALASQGALAAVPVQGVDRGVDVAGLIDAFADAVAG